MLRSANVAQPYRKASKPEFVVVSRVWRVDLFPPLHLSYIGNCALWFSDHKKKKSKANWETNFPHSNSCFMYASKKIGWQIIYFFIYFFIIYYFLFSMLTTSSKWTVSIEFWSFFSRRFCVLFFFFLNSISICNTRSTNAIMEPKQGDALLFWVTLKKQKRN